MSFRTTGNREHRTGTECEYSRPGKSTSLPMRKALDQGNGKSDRGLYLGYLLPKWKEGGGADRRSAAYTGRRGGICEGSRVACACMCSCNSMARLLEELGILMCPWCVGSGRAKRGVRSTRRAEGGENMKEKKAWKKDRPRPRRASKS
mgnify:CR=1 FL=1